MFARRRQEVSRTTDTALSARVIRRGGERHSASTGGSSGNKGKEALAMPDSEGKVDPNTAHDDADGAELDEELDEEFDAPDEEQWRGVRGEEVRSGRRYRPGRGGFDPDAAALAARTKYARRQRIVLVMLVVAVLTALLAGFSWSVLWWFHGIADLSLVGYLGYLRRQVRIEEDVRNRRLARMNGETGRSEDENPRSEPSRAETSAADGGEEGSEDVGPRWAAGGSRVRNGSGVEVLDIDDEDPEFDELDDRLWQPYRRAVGE
nr:gephyrin-like molybdotransferase receptor GlpR [Actinopolyspora biskrensis]